MDDGDSGTGTFGSCRDCWVIGRRKFNNVSSTSVSIKESWDREMGREILDDGKERFSWDGGIGKGATMISSWSFIDCTWNNWLLFPWSNVGLMPRRGSSFILISIESLLYTKIMIIYRIDRQVRFRAGWSLIFFHSLTLWSPPIPSTISSHSASYQGFV